MSEGKRRRITVKYKSANPLFEQWLKEWKRQAEERNSKLHITYAKALCSLQKYPARFNSGQECKILKGFGDKLCKMLDDKLKEYNSHSADRDLVLDNVEEKHKKVTKKLTQLTPSVSVESQENENVDGNTVPKCTTKSKATKKNSKQKLTKKTSSSWETVSSSDESQGYKDVTTVEVSKGTGSDKVTKEKSKQKLTKQTSDTFENISEDSQEDFYILEPGNFDIILYVDTAETIGTTLQKKSDPLLTELNKLPGLRQYEVKKLNVGDYVWICRDRTTKNELVLPYIFERKRLDDFAGSIKDGRYKEQKFRLKRSGMQNIYYLIEKYHTFGLPITTLQQAAFNTAIQDGFKIKMTSNLAHTARLLNKFSCLLTQTFQGKTLLRCSKENLPSADLSDDLVSLMSFKEFNQASVKNKPLKVTDLFIKMLIQIHGMSVEKAVSVTELFPTPTLLNRAYDECDNEVSGEKHLEDVKCGNRKLGLPLSRTVYQLFNFKKY